MVANKQHEISSWEDVLFKRTKQNNILRTYPHEERNDEIWSYGHFFFTWWAWNIYIIIAHLRLKHPPVKPTPARLRTRPLYRFLRHQPWRESYLSEKDILRTQNLIENIVPLNTSLSILNKMKTCLVINPCGRFHFKEEEMALDALSTKEKTEKFVRVVYLFSAGKWQVVFVGNQSY